VKSELTLDDYPARTQQILRYGDTDRQGHVNNAVYATFCESGRVAILYDPSQSMPPQGMNFVIAKLTINFVAEGFYPGTVNIGTRVSRLGSSSATLEQGIFIDDTLCATATSVVVMTDNATRRSTPMSDAVRTRLNAYS